MERRVLPALLVALAGAADVQGAHGLAHLALLAALPLAAVGALAAFGAYLDARRDTVAGAQALLWGLIVALLVLSSAVRSNAVHGVPPLAVSALVGALVLFACKAALAAVPYARRRGDLWPAKP